MYRNVLWQRGLHGDASLRLSTRRDRSGRPSLVIPRRENAFELSASSRPAMSSAILPILNTRLNIAIRRIDERAQSGGICDRSGPQLHMTHALAVALQQAGRITERRAVKEAHIDVRSEYIDVAERRISQACNRTTVMQQLPDFIPALPHNFKPLSGDVSLPCSGLARSATLATGIKRSALPRPLPIGPELRSSLKC